MGLIHQQRLLAGYIREAKFQATRRCCDCTYYFIESVGFNCTAEGNLRRAPQLILAQEDFTDEVGNQTSWSFADFARRSEYSSCVHFYTQSVVD